LIRRRNKRKKGEKLSTKITSTGRHSDSNSVSKVTDEDSDFFLDDSSSSKNKP
jgi:hypothetical protein